ncbi:SGNH/GDSL hydrolase family protein [Nocardiopsis alba]|uniref:GDSL-like Lipase/Acylhydrolase family protein n=1 Tax=Nocardiopsis alba (strain ATCC BAA-2165 / BE74) TaxID=1205910 RepID=J7LA98_NOCAA|nr:GDSL-type esterase/lipase family protein [Nocardiopsis alba]AFR08355.1 GDSL-like Lipase/Acylhydrolase family protein [Nocardiopsis alba ATCC BAA-2165]
MRIQWTAALAAALTITACSAPADEERQERAAPQSHYLSLGDSLTVGVQPDESGVPVETSEGYTDVLYRALKDEDSTLVHERMGCGGEDTTTFIEGGIMRCDLRYEGDSQLDRAVAFLEEHGDRVDLVTLTIGGNNFTGCVNGVPSDPEAEIDPDALGVNEECVADGLERLETEVPVIAERLVEAASPDTRIVAMTYYNPFQALALVTGPEAATSESGPAARTVEIIDAVNASLVDSYEAAGIEVADVAGAFQAAGAETPSEGDGAGLPADLRAVCALTWMCDTVRGPDIHTNPAGARTIAEAFQERLG